MPNVTARYWGIGRHRTLDGSTLIGEVQLYEATTSANEMTQLVADNPMYSDWLSTTALTANIVASMDGDPTTQQTITASIGKRFGIALDCLAQTAVRQIVLLNTSDKDAESFIPFAIDDPSYFLTNSLGVGKIKNYSIAKMEGVAGEFNYVYTILPVVETDSPSIARGSLTKPGVC